MGERSNVELGVTSTEALILQVKHRIAEEREYLKESLLLTYRTRRRRLVAMAQTLTRIDNAWKEIQQGRGSEKELRRMLIDLLTPKVSGGGSGTLLR